MIDTVLPEPASEMVRLGENPDENASLEVKGGWSVKAGWNAFLRFIWRF